MEPNNVGSHPTRENWMDLCSEAATALDRGALGYAYNVSKAAIAAAAGSDWTGDTLRNPRLRTLFCAAVTSQLCGILPEALEYVETALTVAGSVSPGDHRALHYIGRERARILADMGRSEEADSDWQRLISGVTNSQGDPVLEIDTRLLYARFLFEQGRGTKDQMVLAFGALHRVELSQMIDLIKVLVERAEAFSQLGGHREAAELCGEACRRSSAYLTGEQGLTEEYRLKMESLHGQLLLKSGKFDEARVVYQALLQNQLDDGVPFDPRVMDTRDALAGLESQLGYFSRGLKLAEKNLAAAIRCNDKLKETDARKRIAGIYELQGRYQDAHQMRLMSDNGGASPRSSDNREPSDTTAAEISLAEQLIDLDNVPPPKRWIDKCQLLTDYARHYLATDPEHSLKLVAQARDELDNLAPGNTVALNYDLDLIRRQAEADLGGLPKQIEFRERRLADFEKTHGCSLPMTEQFLKHRLARIHSSNGDLERAYELLCEARGFLELREGKNTRLYGEVLGLLATVIEEKFPDDPQAAEEAADLRARAEEIMQEFEGL